jgi:hypothetical protein
MERRNVEGEFAGKLIFLTRATDSVVRLRVFAMSPGKHRKRYGIRYIRRGAQDCFAW